MGQGKGVRPAAFFFLIRCSGELCGPPLLPGLSPAGGLEQRLQMKIFRLFRRLYLWGFSTICWQLFQTTAPGGLNRGRFLDAPTLLNWPSLSLVRVVCCGGPSLRIGLSSGCPFADHRTESATCEPSSSAFSFVRFVIFSRGTSSDITAHADENLNSHKSKFSLVTFVTSGMAKEFSFGT